MNPAGFILCGVIFCEAVVFYRWRCMVRGTVFSVFTGIGSLILLYAMQNSLGFYIPLTTGTMAVSGVLGLPGTILLLLGRIFIQGG